MPTTVRDIIRIIEQRGWYPVSQRGSHRQYKHPTLPGRVTVSGKMSQDIPPGTLRNILRQAQMKPEDLR